MALPFHKRLFWYLIGAALGTLLSVFLFSGRDIGCSYFPNDRVLSDFRKKEMVVPNEMLGAMQALGVDTNALKNQLLNGKVDFENSQTKLDSCKTYWVISADEKDAFRFKAEWQNCSKQLRLLQIKTYSAP